MKKYVFILTGLILFSFQSMSFAEGVVPQNTQSPVHQIVTDYSKTYKTSAENLMYMLLAALNDVNYTIEEIQFKTGHVIFKAYSKEFVASIASRDGADSFINIIPVDNIYNFRPDLIQKLHNFLDLNSAAGFKKVL